MRKKAFLFISLSFFLFCLDRIAKFYAHAYPDTSYFLVHPYLGWEFFANNNSAFSLPISPLLMVGITPLLLLGLFLFARKVIAQNPFALLGFSLIVFGALSNFIDRILLSFTIDYIRIGLGIFNIADCMILLGMVILFFQKPNIPHLFDQKSGRE